MKNLFQSYGYCQLCNVQVCSVWILVWFGFFTTISQYGKTKSQDTLLLRSVAMAEVKNVRRICTQIKREHGHSVKCFFFCINLDQKCYCYYNQTNIYLLGSLYIVLSLCLNSAENLIRVSVNYMQKLGGSLLWATQISELKESNPCTSLLGGIFWTFQVEVLRMFGLAGNAFLPPLLLRY